MQGTLLTQTKRSEELYKQACELIVGGVNSPVRSFKAVGLNPLFISKAKGGYIWDVDQNQYIDFVNSWGALIHGHAEPNVIQVIKEVVNKGTSYGASHELEIELAKIITSKIPSIEKIRFVNSGTEAVMTALRLARAYTKKNKIIKFSGCYHGHSDSVLSLSGSGLTTLGQPLCPGVTKSTANDTISLPYNDSNTIEITLSKYIDQIAAIIVEPVLGNCGVISPENNFLKSLRDLSNKHKCLLIFDEVITGFRLQEGSAQLKYNIIPDITTLGKIIGGGLPLAAVGGRKEIMDLLAPIGPVYQAGTLSGNPLAVACGITTLKLIKDDTYKYLNDLTIMLCEGIKEINEKKNLKIQVNYVDSMFSIFFTENRVYNHHSAQTTNIKIFARFFQNMLSNNIYLAPSQFEANFISTAHNKEDIKKALEAYNKSIDTINFR